MKKNTMKKIVNLSLLTLFTGTVAFSATANDPHAGHGAMPQTSQANAERVISTRGEVKGVDVEAKKLTVAHEPIPALGWPAMTMRFTYEDPAMIKGIKEGDSVKLDFVQRGSLSHIVAVSITQ